MEGDRDALQTLADRGTHSAGGNTDTQTLLAFGTARYVKSLQVVAGYEK